MTNPIAHHRFMIVIRPKASDASFGGAYIERTGVRKAEKAFHEYYDGTELWCNYIIQDLTTEKDIIVGEDGCFYEDDYDDYYGEGIWKIW